MKKKYLMRSIPAILVWMLFSGCAATDVLRSDLGTCNDQLTACRSDLEQSRIALDQCKDEQDAANRRLEAYREIAEKLRKVFNPEDIDIVIQNGRMVVKLPNRILYDFGKADLREDGKESVEKLAGVLITIPDRNFLVVGHTCNVPISQKSTKFKTNRELSTLRALSVVYYLEKLGVDPRQIGAAGYGEYMPDAANDTEEGRGLNRRTEIVFLPMLDEIPAFPDKI